MPFVSDAGQAPRRLMNDNLWFEPLHWPLSCHIACTKCSPSQRKAHFTTRTLPLALCTRTLHRPHALHQVRSRTRGLQGRDRRVLPAEVSSTAAVCEVAKVVALVVGQPSVRQGGGGRPGSTADGSDLGAVLPCDDRRDPMSPGTQSQNTSSYKTPRLVS